MSADGTTPAPPADTTGKAADQGRQAARPPDGARQHGDARQPRETRTRQEYTDAMLARPPGQAHEVAVRVAPSGRDNGQTDQARPERTPGAAPEAKPNSAPGPGVRTRQDHADAMLAHPPGRAREMAVPVATSSPDGRQSRPATSDQAPAPVSHPERPARPLQSREDVPASGQGQPHARSVHRDGEAQPRPEHEGNQADHVTNGDRHPATRPESATATMPSGRDQGDGWTQADRDRVRALYADDFGPKPATAGRDRGVNVVGDKPARSPGDASDLPPSGAELLEQADEDAPRAEKFRRKLYEGVDDLSQGATPMVNIAREYLEQPPPTGHPAVITDTHPYFAPESPSNATPGVGDIIELTLVAGVLADRAIHCGRRIMAEHTGRDRR